MSPVCVVLAPGFEEIEAITIIDVLRRAELDVRVVGTEGLDVTGAHAITVRADATLDDVDEATEWAAVVLPGGIPGATNLRDDARVQALVKRQHAAGRTVGAICAAPIALESAGVLAGRRATSYPAFAEHLASASEVSTEAVVADGHVVTSRGVGTALAFAHRLVAALRDEDTARTLADAMLVPPAAR